MNRGSGDSNAKGDVKNGDISELDIFGESSDSNTKSNGPGSEDGHSSTDGHGSGDGHGGVDRGSEDSNGKADVKNGDKSGLDKTSESSDSSTKSADGKGESNGKGDVKKGDNSGLDKSGDSSDGSTKSSDGKTTNGPTSGDGPVPGDTEGEGHIKDGDNSGLDKNGESSDGKSAKKEKMRATVQKLTNEYLEKYLLPLIDQDDCSPKETTETPNEEEEVLLHLAI